MVSSQRSAARLSAIALAGSRLPRKFIKTYSQPHEQDLKTSEYFGCNTFSFEMMEKKISPRDVATLKEFATSDQPLSLELAQKVAGAVKEWALSRGATHFCHWFQPQTGTTAEKHDAFFSFDNKGNAIERFTARDLIQSEPDASSFPSGGRRSTFEARGYTAWDASSPMFLMESDNGLTLCIPSLFISYSGESLDNKTPLLHSITALNKQAMEAVKLLGSTDVHYVVPTAGPEQEYFVIDEALYNLRPDLMLAGRTLIGRQPPRHQQLEDHYFGSIRPRVLSFMMEVEHELYKLGVPCKTRHNEVAPSQCEVAPIFEFANVAADHNQLLMEVMRYVSKRHNLAVLFHEKPYAGINGSGKHVNWSLADNEGHNLLEPGDKPLDNIRFLYFLAATLKGVHDYSPLLRVAVASAGNDFRLGANEAPPAIISVYLGDTLTEVLDKLASGKPGQLSERVREINLDLAKVPLISRDNTDRNRTSSFAFTGNKFEFRAVGASASISPALTYLNVAAALALGEMNRRLKQLAPSGTPRSEDVLKVIQEIVNETKAVRFEGNGYSDAWHKEAGKRGLPNFKTTPEALKAYKDPRIQNALAENRIHSAEETEARYNVRLEQFVKVRMIELETLHDMVSSEVYPAAAAHLQMLTQTAQGVKAVLGNLPGAQELELKGMSELVSKLAENRHRLAKFISTCHEEGGKEDELAERLATSGLTLMQEVRRVCDELEGLVDDKQWSLPKYREMLYIY